MLAGTLAFLAERTATASEGEQTLVAQVEPFLQQLLAETRTQVTALKDEIAEV